MAEITLASEAAPTARPNTRTIIGVRFMRVGKVYHFDASGHPALKPGDRVIVEGVQKVQPGMPAQAIELGSAPPAPPGSGSPGGAQPPASQ